MKDVLTGLWRVVLTLFGLSMFALFALMGWHGIFGPEKTNVIAAQAHGAQAEQYRQQRNERKKYLCRAFDACQTYDTVRLECATAGNFRTCLRIKMGDQMSLVPACTAEEGAPATLPADTPDRAECLLIWIFD